MVESGHAVVEADDVPVVSMADVEEVPEQFDPLSVRNVWDALGTDELKLSVWELPPGAHMGAHGHERQEECYYVLEGRFRVEVGPPGETETHEVGPGAAFAADPDVVRRYENVGEGTGRVLVAAAPNVEDRGIPAEEL